MRALILVFIMATVCGHRNKIHSYFKSSIQTHCDGVKLRGFCLFGDQLKQFVTGNTKRLTRKCCSDSDAMENAYIVTKNGDQIVKTLNGFFKPMEFDTCAIKGENFCAKCCEVKSNWGNWSPFSQCSVTCGNGTRTRTRTCEKPASSHGCSDCVGVDTETQDCSTLCPAELCATFDGYEFDPATNICIKVFQNKLNFFGAKFQCEEDNGTLFKMDSTAKRDFLALQLQGDTTFSFFLGAIDKNGQNEFIHLDGTAVDWIGEAPLSGRQDCVRFNRPRSEMDETYCYSLYKSVCEKDVTATPSEP
ncbi:uncharacterized protein LOC130010380 [Patella vulgata]|uniref:uncharacterized protein LOC130010380 n=1 Tax=Patella vulgata TaxID=6465 RepID=UPI00217F4DFA|nr:uncharacterized protein LOC130010380 [Patella vulgata]